MSHLTNPEEKYKLAPESLEFTDVYLRTLNINETAEELGITLHDASKFLAKPEVKRFLDTVFVEQGYLNRNKIVSILETTIISKLEEAEESGVYTGKDLMDVMKLLIDFRKDEIKSNKDTVGIQVNQQNNYGSNLSSIIERLVNPAKKCNNIISG